jgi:hypothetical protein
MTALVFNLNDVRLREEEKRRLLQISRDLWSRDRERESPAQDPREQQAAHFRVDRGDLG